MLPGNILPWCKRGFSYNYTYLDVIGIRFCIGDRYYLCDNTILCQFDYEERLVFANLQIQGYAGGLPAISKHSTATKVSASCFNAR